MNGRHTGLLSAGAVAGLACVLAVGFLDGAPHALVSVLAGGLVGAWAHVYVRCMCASQPLALRSLERTIAAGALAVPAVMLLALLVGPAVWVVFAVAALAWAAAVTDDGHLPATRLPGHRPRTPGIGPHA
jgi:tetrahydromethanopterin S-methyltransferase subunit D